MLHVGLFRINTDTISISIVPPPIPVPLTIPETKPVNIFNIISPTSPSNHKKIILADT